MRQDELLLTVLGIAILLNFLLVLASWLGSRRVRRSRASAAQPPADQPVGVPVVPLATAEQADDRRVAAAVEAFVAGVSPDAAGSGRVPTPAEVLASREDALRSALASMPPIHLPSATPDPTEAIDQAPAGHAEEAGSESWERILSEESARVARFGRPSTVVTASLPHLEDVADRWGRDAADRVVAETARLLESEGRAVDRIARLDDATFGILLPETSEIGAARYAERVRAAADAWLMSAGLSVRLEVGWAHVASGADAEPPAATAQPPKRKATRR
jgi:diguanylate cyclase (GGDEF)-like protein